MLCFKIRTDKPQQLPVLSQWEQPPKTIQGVTGGTDQTSGECPYVKLYRYNPKHPYPKLNGYGDNGQRKVWTSCIPRNVRLQL